MDIVYLPSGMKPSLPVSFPWLSRPAPGGLGEVVAGLYCRRRIKAPQEGTCGITPFSLSNCHVDSYCLARSKGEMSAVGRDRPFFVILRLTERVFGGFSPNPTNMFRSTYLGLWAKIPNFKQRRGRLRVYRQMGSATDARRRLRLARHEHASPRSSLAGLPQPSSGYFLLRPLSALTLLPQQAMTAPGLTLGKSALYLRVSDTAVRCRRR
jgi:hypothetical protein